MCEVGPSTSSEVQHGPQVAQDLASRASEVGMARFEERLSFLKQVREIWRVGGNATLQVLEDGEPTKQQPHQSTGTEQPLKAEQVGAASNLFTMEKASLFPMQSEQVHRICRSPNL